MQSTSQRNIRRSETGESRREPRTDNLNDTIETEDIFDILSNKRRRLILYYLKCNGDESDLRTLTEHVAAWENDTQPEKISNKKRMRAYTALRQSHLPKMDRKGVIDFDPDRGTVELRETSAAIDDYIQDVFETDTNWMYIYMGIGTVGLGLTAALLWNVPYVPSVQGTHVGLIVSLAIIIASLFKLGYDRHYSEEGDEFDYLELL